MPVTAYYCKNHWVREFEGKLERQKKRASSSLLEQKTKESKKGIPVSEHSLPFGVVLFDSLNKVRFCV